ncbi:hypothetical protein BHM03_00024949 [Ensete ventricosum]|nr:hypothetical protein BHM03_00024949 [Ensete ventricosum]
MKGKSRRSSDMKGCVVEEGEAEAGRGRGDAVGVSVTGPRNGCFETGDMAGGFTGASAQGEGDALGIIGSAILSLLRGGSRAAGVASDELDLNLRILKGETEVATLQKRSRPAAVASQRAQLCQVNQQLDEVHKEFIKSKEELGESSKGGLSFDI